MNVSGTNVDGNRRCLRGFMTYAHLVPSFNFNEKRPQVTNRYLIATNTGGPFTKAHFEFSFSVT